MRIGHGIDVHQLVEGRKLILGGVTIPHNKGLLGHSDADVLTHALMDAILGALALGDIGKHFPDTDKKYEGADSLKLLSHVSELMMKNGYKIGNIDATIAAQKPKIAPYILNMRQNISSVLQCGIQDVSIKATTTESLGFEGRQEGITAHAVVLLKKI